MAVVSQEEIEKALHFLYARLDKINEHYIKLMAEHIYSIGRLTASDINRLEQMRRMSMNMTQVYKEIADIANISEDQLKEAFEKTITYDDYKPYEGYVRDALSETTFSLKDNPALQRQLEAQVRITHGDLRNFADTTVLSEPYYRAVDQGILAVRNGITDYNTTIRSVIKQSAGMGLRIRQSDGARVVEYASGRTRRLDSAVRQNVLDGIRDINQECMNIIGEQLGCDGVEIDAHNLCAEDHLDYQGDQYSNERFNEIQNSLQRPFGFWNCKHSWSPIIMALAKNHPAYTEEERQAMKNYSREEITIENDKGEPITKSRYEWSQEMRRLETAMRREGDIRTAASVPNGDPTLVRQCGVNIQRFQDAYEKIHQATGIDTRYESTPLPKSNTHIPIDTNLPNPESNASTMLKVDIPTEGNVQKISVNPEFVVGVEKNSDSVLTKYQNKDIIENDKRNIMIFDGKHWADSRDLRNIDDITEKQANDAVEFAVSLGFPRDRIRVARGSTTGVLGGENGILHIANDCYPNPEGRKVNATLSYRAALAHEIIGHYESLLNKNAFEPASLLDEVQASIRAARFAPNITDEDRFMLLMDAYGRIRTAIKEGRESSIKDVWSKLKGIEKR